MEGRPVGLPSGDDVKLFRTSSVLSAIGDKHLKLYAGKSYWYFVYDDGKLYDTHSVFVMRLNEMPLERWIEEGQDFLKKMRAKGMK